MAVGHFLPAASIRFLIDVPSPTESIEAAWKG